MRRLADEPRPVERRHAFAEMPLARGEQQHRSQQSEAEPQAAQHEELPPRFQRRVLVVERDQKHRRQRRQFDGDPHDPQVVRHRHQEHPEHVGRNQPEELAPHAGSDELARFVAAQIPDAIGAGEQAHESAQDQDEGREAVDPQRIAERSRDGAGEKLARRTEAQREGDREPADENPLVQPAKSPEHAERGGDQRNGEYPDEEVHVIPSASRAG